MSSQTRQIRQRKGRAAEAEKEPPRVEEQDAKKQRQQEPPVDLEPNIYVVISLVLAFAACLGTYIYYKVDGRNNGPFFTFVNNNILPKNRYQKM